MAMILSGGGARGAYETGVLKYLYGDFVAREHRLPGVDIVAGSSVGAVNGTFLAAGAHEPAGGARKLVEIWHQLDSAAVFSFRFEQLKHLRRLWVGGGRPVGIFDAAPLMRLVAKNIPWMALSSNLREQRVRALTVATTLVSTGQPHVWLDQSRDLPAPTSLGRGVKMRRGPILPRHVLASAAIPLTFAPVQIAGELHYDGGLRLSTPSAPAIHLGASKLFIVGLSSHRADDQPRFSGQHAPGAAFLLGKMLDAFFLDHLDQDLREIDRINEFMRLGTEAFGDDFLPRMNAASVRHAVPERHHVEYLAVRPSIDLGRLAGDHLRRGAGASPLRQRLYALLDVGAAVEADLASFLLFDQAYVRELIALGERDARARHDELASFFFDSPN